MSLEALIFDVDGTLAETEEIHRASFNQAFQESGLTWRWSIDDYRVLLLTTGGKERIAAYMKSAGLTGGIDIPALHARKTEVYVRAVRNGALKLRPGVASMIRHARAAGLRLAIATTTSRPNVDELLSSTLGVQSIAWFDAIACGDEVLRKKPDPAVFLLALEKLGLAASQCVAFEDSHQGLKAAVTAGLTTIVTPGIYTFGQDFSSASLVIENLDKPLSYLEMGSPKSISDLPADIRNLLLRREDHTSLAVAANPDL